ncbi:MAG TPA: SAM-dependent methyltransferase [Blastocatellia bacterium]|nr:SAM-dependent methyltransferase [Blastocatellia bacterium]
MSAEATPLERKLIERISRDGPLTFRDFMEAALYDAEFGYYHTERLKIGAAGDFTTSSNVHPAFGATLARAFAELWREAFDGEPLTLAEMGAGTGQLAADLLAALRDEHAPLFSSARYLIVETSPAMQKRQRERLADFGERVAWRTLDDLERRPLTAIFFSNELVDALPVHRARWKGKGVQEQFVVLAGGRLALAWAAPSKPELFGYAEQLGVRLRENQVIEVNLDALGWLAGVSRALRRGFLVTMDYGDLAALLYAPDRAQGTLRSFYRHRLLDSPLERVGEQDITASVNFTALIEGGREFGLETLRYERQTAFLLRHGLIERIAATHRAVETLADVKARLAIKNLFVPGGASDNFRVLVQKKLAEV